MRLRNIPGSREEIAESAFVVQDPEHHKGHWRQVFQNGNPIHIEVGMGKGRFLMDMARLHPEINYIGIEMYSSVLVRALQKAEEDQKNDPERVTNFRFLRMDAQHLDQVFATGEVDKIYLNFSDPWPKDRHAKRRLTSALFLKLYEVILKQGGNLEFKTDNQDLFAFSLESVKGKGWTLTGETWDLHKNAEMNQGNVMTEYEEKFSAAGNPICKLIAHP